MQHPQLGALGFKDLNTLIMFYVMGMTNQPDFGLSSYVSEQASSTAMNSQQQARSTVRLNLMAQAVFGFSIFGGFPKLRFSRVP